MSVPDDQLLGRASRGDADAFAEFFRRHQVAVTRYAARRCELSADIPDVVADVFVAALERAGGYRPETATARPWLFGIATRIIAGRRRALLRQSRAFLRLPGHQRSDTGNSGDLAAEAIDASRRYAGFRCAVATLPRSERDVLCLVALADLSPSEAAVALGISPNAARVRLSRARARLADVSCIDPTHPEVSRV